MPSSNFNYIDISIFILSVSYHSSLLINVPSWFMSMKERKFETTLNIRYKVCVTNLFSNTITSLQYFLPFYFIFIILRFKKFIYSTMIKYERSSNFQINLHSDNIQYFTKLILIILRNSCLLQNCPKTFLLNHHCGIANSKMSIWISLESYLQKRKR